MDNILSFIQGDKFIEFGRPPVWNCPMPEEDEEHSVKQPVQRRPVSQDSVSPYLT